MDDQFPGRATYCRYDIPIKQKYKFNYIHPKTSASYHVAVTYEFNEEVPEAIENNFLRSPEYSSWDSKLKILEPLYTAHLESLTLDQLFPTVTGLQFKTLNDGSLTWTTFEDAGELPDYVPLESISTDLPKVSIKELSKFRRLRGFAYSVNYQNEKHVLKYHGTPMQDRLFRAELNAQLSIRNIPHVLSITSIVTDKNAFDEKLHVAGMLLKFCQKGDIGYLLSYKEPNLNDWKRKTKWATQITHGLMGLHEAGIVHGDLRCANIVVDENDDAHIIDIIQETGYAAKWTCMGDDRTDPRRDVYSLGVTFWEIGCNGEQPIHPLGPLANDTFDHLVRCTVVEDASQRVMLDHVFDLLGGKAVCGCLADS